MTIRNLLAITAAALAAIRGGVAADSQLAPAVNSGNSILMRAAVRDATTILTIHKADGENPNLRRPRPPLPEVMRQFQALVPALLAHFGDLTASTPVIAAGQTDYTEIGWKTCVAAAFPSGTVPCNFFVYTESPVEYTTPGGRCGNQHSPPDPSVRTPPPPYVQP